MENEIIEYIVANKEKHYRLAYSYVKNKDDALDIVQDAIVKALRYQGTLQENKYLHTWFCKIIINTAKTHLQKQKRYVDIEDEFLEQHQDATYDHYTNFELKDALNKLSFNEKSIVILKYDQSLAFKEIAEILDQNISTVKSVLYRSLKKLKVTLERNEKEYPDGNKVKGNI